MSDPYRSPRTVPRQRDEDPPDSLLAAWARLATIYNAVLTLLTVTTSLLLAGLEFLIGHVPYMVVLAAMANACFLAGPFVEFGYRLLGGRGMGLRRGLFIGGTLFACALAFGFVVAMAEEPMGVPY